MIKHRLTINSGNEIQTYLLDYNVRPNLVRKFTATVADEKTKLSEVIESEKPVFMTQKLKTYFSSKGKIVSVQRIDSFADGYFDSHDKTNEKAAYQEIELGIKAMINREEK